MSRACSTVRREGVWGGAANFVATLKTQYTLRCILLQLCVAVALVLVAVVAAAAIRICVDENSIFECCAGEGGGWGVSKNAFIRKFMYLTVDDDADERKR